MKKLKIPIIFKLSEAEKYMLRGDIYSKILMYSSVDETGINTRGSFVPFLKRKKPISGDPTQPSPFKYKNTKRFDESVISSNNSSGSDEFYKPEEFKNSEKKTELLFDGSLKTAKTLLTTKIEHVVKPFPDFSVMFLSVLVKKLINLYICKKIFFC
jgi:hypothetical protein